MTNAYNKVKTDCAPKTARDMWRCWYEYVMAHEPGAGQRDDRGQRRTAVQLTHHCPCADDECGAATPLRRRAVWKGAT